MARVVQRRRRRWDVLTDLVKQNDLRLGAELGVFDGKTFHHLLSACPHLTMVGVDMWKPLPKEEAPGARTYAEHDLEGMFERLLSMKQPYGDRAQLMRMSTVDAALWFNDRELDFVFIDADHTYDGVMADIEAWTPKVARGGFVCGHDYQVTFPGVVKAVDKVFPQRTLHEDSVWIAPV